VFDPLRFPVIRAPSFNEPRAFETAVELIQQHREELAAVIIEPLVQGAAGMQFAAPDEINRIGAACARSGVLLICDEVATGFGRTGTLFASEQCGLRPDLLCLGKGITGGYLPMSATVASQRVFDAFLGPDLSERTFYHGHSYGGNALAAAVALRHLQLFKERNVLANVNARSAQLRASLDALAQANGCVAEIRLIGLMGAVQISDAAGSSRTARKIAAAMVRRGVLTRSLGNVVTLVPPLTITAAEIDRIVAALAAALDEVVS
jgi:adenosylmethionine-8-amino-7-oxononanoate aminotransferase